MKLWLKLLLGAVLLSLALVTRTYAAPGVPVIVSPNGGDTYTVGSIVSLSTQASIGGTGLITSVQFFVGTDAISTPILTPTTVQSGIPIYNYEWQPAATGTYHITAVATDTSLATTTSAVVTITVTNSGAPTVTVSCPATIAVNKAQTITADARAATGSISQVQFFVDGTSVGTATAYPYSATWTPTSLGTYSLRAVARDNLGNQHTSAAVTVFVSVLPTVSITGPVDGASLAVGVAQTITASASTTAALATITGVQFFANGVSLGTDNTFPYTMAWTPGVAGTYTLTAVATDSNGLQTTSAAVNVSTSSPGISITLPANGSSLTVNVAQDITANAVAVGGATVTNVQFLVNGTPMGAPVSVPPYKITWTPTTLGTFALTAAMTDSTAVITTSAAVSVTVVSAGGGKLSPTGISAQPASALPGDTVTFTVSVNNGAATAFGIPAAATADFRVVLTNHVTRASFTIPQNGVAPTSGFIAAATVDATTGILTPGVGTFTFSGFVPTWATQAGSYDATVTITAVSAGGIGTPSFTVNSVLTITGKPDLQITSLTYPAGTSYVGGNVIPMSLTYRNNSSTNGTRNVPYTPGINGAPAFVRIQVVLSSNPTFGDADDFQLTIEDISAGNLGTAPQVDTAGNPVVNADGVPHTFSWNQILPGNFSGSYYVLAKVDTLNALSQNDPPALTVNGNNVWGGNQLNPSGTLINLIPSNFPTVYLASHGKGVATTASGYSDNPSMTSDGRYMAFASDATNLVDATSVGGADTNGVRDIFIFDSQTSLVRRLSLSQQGAQGNAASNNPSISSANGRYVAFESNANNLVLGDTNGFSDIFVVDTLTGLISRISGANATGGQANNPSFKPAISQTGRYVVFQSTATNLTATATTVGRSHIYLYNRDVLNTGVFDTVGNTSTTMIDVSTTGTEGNGNSIQAAISADGSTVAFTSAATNLDPNFADTNGRPDVFVRNVAGATTKRVSVANATHAEGDGDSQTPSLSSDGHWVAFASLATNLVAGDTNGVSDIFVYDNTAAVSTPVVRLMSVVTGTATAGTDPSSAGFQLGSINPTISADGRYVAFASLDSDLTSGDINGQYQATDSNNALDVFVHDRDSTASGTYDTVATTTTMVSVNPFGYQTNGLLGTPSTAASNIYPVISADGRFVAFPSDAENNAGLAFGATNLLPLDSNGLRDVFLFDRRTTATIAPATPPTVTITSPGTGSAVLVNTAIPITATATTNIGVVSSVQFFVNGTSLGTSTVFPYTQTWTPTAVGIFTLSALVTDSFGNLGVSSNVTVTVNAAPSVGITNPVAGTTITVGTLTNVTATAAASNPGATITSVQFRVNGAALGAAIVPPAALSVAWTPLSTGTYTLTAVATDSVGTQSVSPDVIVTVAAAGGGGGGGGPPPSIVITSPAAGSTVQVNLLQTITATASATGGTVTQVQFLVNNVSLSTSTRFPFTADWTPTTPGTFVLTAIATDNFGGTATSLPVTVTVSTGTAPTVSITSPAAGNIGVNLPQTITATATSTTGVVASVEFFANSVSLGTVTTFPYSLPWTPGALGTYSLTAVAKDNVGNKLTSAPVIVTVVHGLSPLVSITSPVNGSAYGVGTPLAITASASDPDGTIASVQFLANGIAQGAAVTQSPYITDWTPASPGNYVLTAVATDNSGNQTTSAAVNVSIGVNASPTVSITSPATGLSFGLGSAVILAAQAADTDGTIASVRFFANGQAVGTALAAPYLVSWSPQAAGNYSITAQATDNFGNVTTSVAVNVTINSSGAPAVAFTSPAAGSSFGVGTQITLNATASGGNGPIAQVQFFVNGISLFVDTAAPYSASWAPVAAGTYNLVAVATDSAGISTTSAVLAVTITGVNAPSVTLTNPAAAMRITAGTAVSLAANATSFSSTVAGVRFLANGFVIGTAGAAPFTASWTPTAAGAYSIVAEATDAVGNVATTAPVVVTVIANLPPIVALTAPTNGSVLRVSSGVTLRASASDPDGTISQVQFVANGVTVGTTSLVTNLGYTAVWTPASEGVYRLTAVATDNAGATITSSTVYVLVVGSDLSSIDTVYSGSYAWLSESGRFAFINLHGTSATFIGYSTTLPTKLYYYPGLPVDAAGGFSLTDAAGNSLISGNVSDTGVGGTLGAGISAVPFSSPLILAATSPVAAGYYAGSIGGNYASTLAGIVGNDGSITVYVTDGSFRDAGSSTLAKDGSFTITTAATHSVLKGKIDPATNFLTGTISGGDSGSLVGAIGSGVSFSDGVLKSLSTRGQAGTGENMLTAGFIVGGTTAKRVLIRAVGPTLGAAPYNVSGALVDPQFSVIPLGGSVAVAGNDNWGGTAALQAAFAQVYAFGLPPTSKDAAAIVTLSPGGYTVQVSSVTGATGVALVELYDLDAVDPFTAQKMTGVSTRGLVGAGDNVLIAGVSVNGNLPKKVLVRAVGPTLAGFGVSNTLSDPILTIKSGNTTVRENDNWESGNDPALVTEATVKLGLYALPSGSKDAVILMTLPPGLYTAIVSSANGATGIALVEVYEVP